MKMDKVQCCAVIQYLNKKDLSPKAIHEDMVNNYVEDAPSYSVVKR